MDNSHEAVLVGIVYLGPWCPRFLKPTRVIDDDVAACDVVELGKVRSAKDVM
jgi:hypothetical protein